MRLCFVANERDSASNSLEDQCRLLKVDEQAGTVGDGWLCCFENETPNVASN